MRVKSLALLIILFLFFPGMGVSAEQECWEGTENTCDAHLACCAQDAVDNLDEPEDSVGVCVEKWEICNDIIGVDPV
jgi:hypothetical protein